MLPQNNEFEFTVARSSGPGGQNVNKVNSKVILRWNVVESPSLPEPVRARFLARYAPRLTREGCVLISSDTFRDQPQNKQACIDKLYAMIRAVEHAPKARRKTKPSRSAKNERTNTKKKHGAKKSARGRVRDFD